MGPVLWRVARVHVGRLPGCQFLVTYGYCGKSGAECDRYCLHGGPGRVHRQAVGHLG